MAVNNLFRYENPDPCGPQLLTLEMRQDEEERKGEKEEDEGGYIEKKVTPQLIVDNTTFYLKAFAIEDAYHYPDEPSGLLR